MLSDLRYSIRSLLRAPGFTSITVLTLALGIGAATAIFSVVEGVLLEPLPYPDSDRIAQLWQVNEAGGHSQLSDPNYTDLRDRTTAFAALAQYQTDEISVSGGREAERVAAAYVSREFFDVLAVRPLSGRTFSPQELVEGGAPAVIISYSFWQRALGGDPRFADRTLSADDRVFPIIGVMPPGFDFPSGTDMWAARELLPVNASRTAHNWRAVGRLAPGSSMEQAQTQLRAVASDLARQLGDDTWMKDAAVVPLREQLVGRVRPALLLLLGASGLLLLIAGANVANLLLARAAARHGELSLRLALGAESGRLARLFLAETLVISGASGVLGVLIALWMLAGLVALEPGNLPRLSEVGVDRWAILFAIALSVVTALLLGLAVLMRATRAAAMQTLVTGHRTMGGTTSSGRLRGTLVASQVAMTVVLLVGASLLGRSFLELVSVDPGFRRSGATLMTLAMPQPRTANDMARMTAFFDDVMARAASIPGVNSVGGANDLPMDEYWSNGTFGILTSLDEMERITDLRAFMSDKSRLGEAEYRLATPGYFSAMEIPLRRGRMFDDRDAAGAPHVAVISEALANERWPDEDPIGKIIQFGNMDGDLTPMTVVGVVGDVKEFGLDQPPASIIYGNARQRPRKASTFTIVMAGPGETAAIAAAARRIVRELRPDVPPSFSTVDALIGESVAPRKFSLTLLGTFGAAALMLALMGMYGVTAYAVAQRTQEIGIRMALGARAASVVGMMVGRSVFAALLGLTIGLVAAVALTGLLESQLYGVTPLDPATFAGVALLLIGMAAVSAWLPARRASRIDPVIALRTE